MYTRLVKMAAFQEMERTIKPSSIQIAAEDCLGVPHSCFEQSYRVERHKTVDKSSHRPKAFRNEGLSTFVDERGIVSDFDSREVCDAQSAANSQRATSGRGDCIDRHPSRGQDVSSFTDGAVRCSPSKDLPGGNERSKRCPVMLVFRLNCSRPGTQNHNSLRVFGCALG